MSKSLLKYLLSYVNASTERVDVSCGMTQETSFPVYPARIPQSPSHVNTIYHRHLSHKKGESVGFSVIVYSAYGDISTHRISTQDLLLEKGVQGSSPGAWLSQLSIAQLEPSVLPETFVSRLVLSVVDL